MSTVSTTISAPRGSNLDSRDPMAGMDAKQRSQFLATLRNTSMFFKKLSFGRRRAMPQMNDDMNASIFPRTDHAVQLGQKAFNMSQPTLGCTSVPRWAWTLPRLFLANTPKTCRVRFQASFDLLTSSGSSTRGGGHVASADGNGLPPIPEPATKAVDGLPPSSSPPVPLSLIPGERTHDVSDSASTIFQDAPCCVNGDCEQCKQSNPTRSVVQSASGSNTVDSSPLKSNEQTTPQPSLLNSPQVRQTQSLPSRRLQAPSLAPSLSQSSSVDMSETMVTSPATPGEPTPRALHPRLASLPPPMMARFNAQGSARLTPSIVSRPPPMPILNLPTLPPPTPPQPPSSASQSSHTRLRSMPALPHRGPSDMDVISADHENAGLDEMEDLDEEDEIARM
ncbi:hypothetical protein BC629DRAFT_1597648 [Irpex lacteus]|nr:hypothetical protein BC629DRAFT_1597648 [Irpex lacteus]